MLWNYAFSFFPMLESKYLEINDIISKGGLSTDSYKKLSNARKEILKKVSEKESELILQASVIATTATKATINPLIYDQHWDVVIFDEVSMAYVPQIIFASSLAKQNLILIGDFRQLSPIVSCPDATILKQDIFSYLHVQDRYGKVRKHPWLVMLNKQWRMHPEIASYINERIYENLETANESIKSTQLIASRKPFPGKVFSFVDYSHFQGLCISTNNGSRFNLFSAAIAVKLALLSASYGSSVGIVTPYAAQSEIIKSMLIDYQEQESTTVDVFVSTIHQFQGSEKDVIIFDSVENEPKKSEGVILSEQEDNDGSMRLINVALTRAKGKFILVGSYDFLSRLDGLSEEMQALMNHCIESNHIYQKERISPLLLQVNIVDFFPKKDEAIDQFKEDFEASGRFEYWHSAKNTFDINDPLFEWVLSKKGIIKRFYATDTASNIFSEDMRKHYAMIGINAKDDFIILDKDVLWSNIISVRNRYNSHRYSYRIFGNNTVEKLYEIADLKEAIKRGKTTELLEKAENSPFYRLLRRNFSCSCCGGEPILKKAKSGKFYIVCKSCNSVIQNYVPSEIYSEFINEKSIRCKECGTILSVSRMGDIYCKKSMIDKKKHNIGVTIEDLISKNFSSTVKLDKKPAYLVKKNKS